MICGHSVSSHLKVDIILKMDINVTCCGIMKATMTMAKRNPRPLNSNLANAYEAGIITAVCRMSVPTLTSTLLSR